MTEYASLTTEELIQYTLERDSRTSLEVELAERLELAMHSIDEEDELHDARRQGKAGH